MSLGSLLGRGSDAGVVNALHLALLMAVVFVAFQFGKARRRDFAHRGLLEDGDVETKRFELYVLVVVAVVAFAILAVAHAGGLCGAVKMDAVTFCVRH